jgi:hypothetical protein
MKNEDYKHSINLLDIVRGYSVLTYGKKVYYFKHFSIIALLELDYLEKMDLAASVKAGIKKEEDLIELAIKRKTWSISKEEKMKSLAWMIKKSMNELKKMNDPAQKKIFQAQIKNQERDLKELKRERAEICRYSAEVLVGLKKVKKMMSGSLFLDKALTKKCSEEEKEDLAALLVERNNELTDRETLISASWFGGFFNLFAAQGDGSFKLLDKSFEEMTSPQKNLIILSNALLNKIKNTQMPEEIMDDPVRMLDYEEKEVSENKTSYGIDDLKRKMEARGGELKAEDFLSG